MAVRIPRIRRIWWILIIGVIAVVPVGIALTINIIFDITWWLTWGVGIFEGLLGLVAFFIWLVVKIQVQVPPKIRLSPADAKEKVIEDIKMDDNNPDNFIPETQIIKRVGEKGQPRTPILWLHGIGSETDTRIDAIVNLDNIKLEMSRLDNAPKSEVEQTIEKMAEFPETLEVEKATTQFDAFNRPITTIETKKLSQAEKTAEKEKEEADKAGVY